YPVKADCEHRRSCDRGGRRRRRNHPVMSYRMENASRAGALEIVLEAFEPTPRPVNIVYPEQRLLPLKVRAFLDWATPRLKVRLTQQLARPDNQTMTD